MDRLAEIVEGYSRLPIHVRLESGVSPGDTTAICQAIKDVSFLSGKIGQTIIGGKGFEKQASEENYFLPVSNEDLIRLQIAEGRDRERVVRRIYRARVAELLGLSESVHRSIGPKVDLVCSMRPIPVESTEKLIKEARLEEKHGHFCSDCQRRLRGSDN